MAAERQTGKLRVFISYSRADEAFAAELERYLDREGYSVEIDKHSIRQGEEWKARLSKLIAASGTVVFVLSPDSARSPICHWEVEEAYAQGKRIVPVLHRGLNDRPKGAQPDGRPWPEGPAKAPERLTLINYPRFDEGRSFVAGLHGLVEALEADHDWIEAHTRLATRARDWDDGGRPTNRLMSGPDIAAAKRLVETRKASAPPMLPAQLDFILSSEEHETAQKSEREREADEKRRLAEEALAQSRLAGRRTRQGLAVALVLLLLAVGAGGFALWQFMEATQQRETALKSAELARAEALRAERSEKAADATTREAQITQSGLLSEAARSILERPADTEAPIAMLLVLEGMPDKTSDDARQTSRPRVVETQFQLDRAFRNNRERWLSVHTDEVSALAWSPDGRLLASGATDKGEVRIVDPATGKHFVQLTGLGAILDLKWSPDGRALAAISQPYTNNHGVSEGGGLLLLDVAGNKLAAYKDVQAVTWSSDGRLLATGADEADNGEALVVAASGREMARLNLKVPVSTMAWSIDGTLLAAGLMNGDKAELLIVEAMTGKRVARVVHNHPINAVAWSPTGLLVAMGGGDNISTDNVVRIFRTTGQEQGRLSVKGSIRQVAWSPNGRLLATASRWGESFDAQGEGRIFEVAARRQIAQLDGAMIDIVWSPDGQSVAMVSGARESAHTVSFVDAVRGRKFGEINRDGWIGSVSWSPDSNLLAAMSQGHEFDRIAMGSAFVIDANTQGSRLQVEFKGGANKVTWSPDGRFLATGATDRTVRIFALSKADAHLFVDMVDGWIDAQSKAKQVAWSPDGKSFAVLGRRISYDSSQREAVSPNGGLRASADPDGLRIANSATGQHMAQIKTTRSVHSVAWSPDSRLLATASGDPGSLGPGGRPASGEAKIINAASGETLAQLLHDEELAAVTWSPDGLLLATTSVEGNTRVFEAATGQELAKLTFWEGEPPKVASTNNPSGSAQGAASRRIWRVFPTAQALVDAAKARAARCLTQSQRAQYFLPPAPPTWCVERRLWPYHGDDWQAWLPKQKTWLASGRQGDAPPLPKAE